MNEISNPGEKQKRPAWWRYLFGIISFWLLSAFGGLIPMLWNALSPRFSRYMPGDLGYLILCLCANAIGAMLAICALRSIVQHKAPLCGVINCVVAIVLDVVLVVLAIFYANATWSTLISYTLMVLVYIWGACIFAKELKQ